MSDTNEYPSEVTIHINLYPLENSADKEVFKILKSAETDSIRKQLIVDSVLYYTHSPYYTSEVQLKALFDSFLKKFKFQVDSIPKVLPVQAQLPEQLQPAIQDQTEESPFKGSTSLRSKMSSIRSKSKKLTDVL
jgi:hypothetical protein